MAAARTTATRIRGWLALGPLLAALLAAGSAAAGPLDALVSPGELSHAHADLERDCGKCHRPFEAGAQAQLCLACHEAVAADRLAHTGLHGRSRSAAGDVCRTCHPEHRGRGAALVTLDRASFPHGDTDHPLRGAHTSVPCASCHAAGKKWRDAPADCAACHRGADPHAGRLGEDCARCHGETSWHETRFDHGATRFALEGAHAQVACGACHPTARYTDAPTDCGACHAVDDVHRGRLGADCASCHGVGGWKEVRFDHGKTRFALRGAHARASCDACHASGAAPSALPTDCGSCHGADDVHEGRNGPRCGDCHGASAWKPAGFDHGRTRFPLRGAHAAARCESCHTQGVGPKLETRCAACHGRDDPHRGEQGEDCGRCHGEAGWRDAVSFDHDLARFPLLGLHAVAACEECHSSAAFRGAERTCAGCHAKDDRHERRLGTACETCHNANGWPLWRFDHDARTAFALHGAHERASCESCHRQPVQERISLPQRCASCHGRDDPHRGGFGARCEDCHVERGWAEVSVQR